MIDLAKVYYISAPSYFGGSRSKRRDLHAIFDAVLYASEEEGEDQREAIEQMSAEVWAKTELDYWTTPGSNGYATAFDTRQEAAQAAMSEDEPHSVFEATPNDLIAYYRERGWAQ